MHLPKGLFCTKGAMAQEIIEFDYRRSNSLSAPIHCHFLQKNSVDPSP